MVDMLVLKLQTHASQVFLSIVCTVQKPSYLKADHPVVTIALAFGLPKLQAAYQCMLAGSYMSHTYLGSQLAHYTLSYIESVKNCLLEYDLWQSASTFFQNCGPNTVLVKTLTS
jgi:hypothetical protein